MKTTTQQRIHKLETELAELKRVEKDDRLRQYRIKVNKLLHDMSTDEMWDFFAVLRDYILERQSSDTVDDE